MIYRVKISSIYEGVPYTYYLGPYSKEHVAKGQLTLYKKHLRKSRLLNDLSSYTLSIEYADPVWKEVSTFDPQKVTETV